MPFIEAPTNFYLGRRYDPATHRLTESVVYYDSRDLTTHAVVLGMTGSGKTGLCITLLEEAALDNIPAIVIDPKGDITNLLLTFPDLRPEDFAPWVNADDAQRAGLDLPQYAADVAHQWRDGLSSWGIVPDRLRWLKQAASYSIYTPGSDAGLPISILASLRAPREGWAGNEEALRERVNGTVTALLALVGKNYQPMQDKEHVLVSNIFEYAWSQGRDLTLEDVILQVQSPPFDKLGVFAVDDYIGEKDRYRLAMELNNIIAAPSFKSWIDGEPMDIQKLLYRPDGRPKVSIFYTAHLSEPERMFITTLLLENLTGWMRTLSGTTSLRALLYIDEMYGYFPPYPRNPPTKEPIVRLLKQARAFGLGLILATQNPGDLDYKGLSNAGTWFIGRLQSENDKQRVMSGLQSLATTDSEMDLKEVSQLISDIEPRVFLMHDIHSDGGPIMLHTRWAMNYLRGPLTRQQIAVLMASQRQALLASRPVAVPQSGAPTAAFAPPPPLGLPEMPSALPETDNFTAQSAPVVPNFSPTAPLTPPPGALQTPALAGFSPSRPPVSSTTPQYFLPHAISAQQAISGWEQRTNFRAQSDEGVALAYVPVLLAQASIRFSDRRANLYTARTFAYHVPDIDRAGLVRWDEHSAPPVDTRRVSGEPLAQAVYGDLPSGLSDPKRLAALKREFGEMLYNTVRLNVPYNAALDIYGSPDSDFSEFRSRAAQAAREKRDAEIDALKQKYEALLDRLDEELRRVTQKLDTERGELSEQKRAELFTTGEAVISLLRGRTRFTLSRMSHAALSRKRTTGTIKLYEQQLLETDDKIQKAQSDYQTAIAAANNNWAQAAQKVDAYLVTPFKKDIMIDLFGVGWVPYWVAQINGQALVLPAFAG